MQRGVAVTSSRWYTVQSGKLETHAPLGLTKCGTQALPMCCHDCSAKQSVLTMRGSL